MLLCRALGAAEGSAAWYERLSDAYREPQRYYHNQRHIAECLAEFDQASHLVQHPAVVELAIWFHDAAYDPRAADNEEQSAALAQQFMRESGLPGGTVKSVERLIWLTKTHKAKADTDAGILVDVDLSILGRPEKRFFEYERQIRQEYAGVPEAEFASKRSEILERFLCRDRIYVTEWFGEKYERRARRNLAASLEKLRHISE